MDCTANLPLSQTAPPQPGTTMPAATGQASFAAMLVQAGATMAPEPTRGQAIGPDGLAGGDMQPQAPAQGIDPAAAALSGALLPLQMAPAPSPMPSPPPVADGTDADGVVASVTPGAVSVTRGATGSDGNAAAPAAGVVPSDDDQALPTPGTQRPDPAAGAIELRPRTAAPPGAPGTAASQATLPVPLEAGGRTTAPTAEQPAPARRAANRVRPGPKANDTGGTATDPTVAKPITPTEGQPRTGVTKAPGTTQAATSTQPRGLAAADAATLDGEPAPAPRPTAAAPAPPIPVPIAQDPPARGTAALRPVPEVQATGGIETSSSAAAVAPPIIREPQAAEAPAPPTAPPSATPARQVAPVLVSVAIAGGTARLSVTLDPAELGRVEISVERHGETTDVRVLAERPETLALLQRDQRELDRALNQAGVGADGRSLSFSLSDGGGGAFASGGDGRGRMARDTRDAGGAGGTPDALSAAGVPSRRSLSLLDLAV